MEIACRPTLWQSGGDQKEYGVRKHLKPNSGSVKLAIQVLRLIVSIIRLLSLVVQPGPLGGGNGGSQYCSTFSRAVNSRFHRI